MCNHFTCTLHRDGRLAGMSAYRLLELLGFGVPSEPQREPWVLECVPIGCIVVVLSLQHTASTSGGMWAVPGGVGHV
jgi:hypothetical protein